MHLGILAQQKQNKAKRMRKGNINSFERSTCTKLIDLNPYLSNSGLTDQTPSDASSLLNLYYAIPCQPSYGSSMARYHRS